MTYRKKISFILIQNKMVSSGVNRVMFVACKEERYRVTFSPGKFLNQMWIFFTCYILEKNNGMLHYVHLGVGKVIFLKHIMCP